MDTIHPERREGPVLYCYWKIVASATIMCNEQIIPHQTAERKCER